MNKAQEISDKLKTLLDWLAWSGQPFVNVFDYYTLQKTWFPYVAFECVWYTATILDSCNNQRNYLFDVHIFQEIIGNDRQESTQILYKAMSDVIDAIDTDYTLTWSCEAWVLPVAGNIQGIITESGKALVLQIQIVCQSITFIK